MGESRRTPSEDEHETSLERFARVCLRSKIRVCLRQSRGFSVVSDDKVLLFRNILIIE